MDNQDLLNQLFSFFTNSSNVNYPDYVKILSNNHNIYHNLTFYKTFAYLGNLGNVISINDIKSQMH
jgi:hypothetical protein